MSKYIILASSSPQRADILRELGFDFNAVPMDVDEVVFPSPEETVEANARLKALTAYSRFPHEIIIAADTVISHGGKVLGKPKNAKAAEAVLSSLSGKKVKAVSSVAVINPSAESICVVTESAVAHMRTLSGRDIYWYIGTGEPLTRAGALGISRYGEIFIERIDGSYSCFAGLPKRALLVAISKVGLARAILPDVLLENASITTTGLGISHSAIT